MIPIVENTFEYTFTVSAPEVYHLVFEDEFNSGTWRRIEFFPEEGKVLFTLYPMMEGDKNKIEGGKLNKQLRDYWLAYTKNYQEKVDPKSEPLTEKIRELWNIGEGESPKADSLRRERDVFENRQKDWYYNYIDSNPSLVSYYLFTSNLLIIAEYPNDIISHRASMFSKLYPDHPYTMIVRKKLESLKSIRVGGKYIDFSAPDLEGNIVKFSDVLNEEHDYVLIDFWASWCGPCIETSRSMVPVYKEFKDRGFSVLGIAREFKNADAMKRTLARDKYPWLNLIELNDENGIWDKYNLTFNSGGTVLIHKSGEVVAVSPTADELREILQLELLE